MNKNKKKSKFLVNKSLSMNEELSVFNSSFSHPINEEQQNDSDEGQKQQVKKPVGIFEQFKIKYDELRKDNQQKRKQIDELNRFSKRLEIQLLNVNTQFYDKEIKRLRDQVQKIQAESQDYKFKYFQTENKRKQVQSSLAMSETQIKKIIKNLETQKIQNVELKHQLKQKERQYMDIIHTVQEASNKTAQKYETSQGKLNRTQNELKQAQRQIQIEKKKIEKLQKYKRQADNQAKKNVQKLQIQITNASKSLDESQNRCRQYRNQISALKQSILSLQLQIKKGKSLFDFQANRSFQKINHFRTSRILEIQNKRLSQENQNLALKLSKTNDSILELQNQFKIKTQHQQNFIKQGETKLLDLQNKKNAVEKQYESMNLALKKEVQILKIKCMKSQPSEDNKSLSLKSNSSSNLHFRNSLGGTKGVSSQLSISDSFQQILKLKDQETAQLKQLLSLKVEQIFKLKQQIQDFKTSKQILQNQVEILQKRLNIQKKNLKTFSSIQISQMKSELQSLKRKLQLGQTKLKTKIKEIKEKDKFITDTIVGRMQRQEDVPLIVAELQRVFQADYLEKLAQAQEKIKMLQTK